MIAVGWLIPVLGAVCVFLFTISLIPQKNALQETLKMLEAQQDATGGDVPPSAMERMLEGIIPRERTGSVSRLLLQAGWYKVTPAQMVIRFIAAGCAGVAVGMLVGPMLGLPGLLTLAAEAIIAFGIGYVPMAMLTRAAENRETQVQRALPDFLDMVASTVQAGVAMNAALAYAVDAAPGALGDEVQEALAEVRLGRSKAEALKAAAWRLNQVEFTTAVAAITQAERLGGNIANLLTDVAEDTRNRRIMAVEEHATKLPVKMAIPMALFLLPALFVLIIGSLAANYFSHPV